jgi:hypothetical protein
MLAGALDRIEQRRGPADPRLTRAAALLAELPG